MSNTPLHNPSVPAEVWALAADTATLRLTLSELAAQAKGVIDLAGDDPDLPTPPHIIAAAEAALHAGKTQPSPVAGLPELREAIAAQRSQESGLPFSPDNVIVTAGGQEGLYLTMQALLNPADAVLIPDPCDPTYRAAIEAAGGHAVPIAIQSTNGFPMQPEAVHAAITPQTKALIITSPANPTGAALSIGDLHQIVDITARHNLILIFDERYPAFIGQGQAPIRVGTLPNPPERTITIHSFTMPYAMAGWRCGYVVAPTDFIDGMARVKAHTTGPTATISQWAALAALTAPESAGGLAEAQNLYRERRDLVVNTLQELGLPFSEPYGLFHVWAGVGAAGLPAGVFAYLMLREGQVMVGLGDGYGPAWGGFVRISLFQPMDQIAQAMTRLKAIVGRYRLSV